MLQFGCQIEIQAQISEYEVKAAFLERFTRFVEWDDAERLDQEDSVFYIVVLGEHLFGESLNVLFENTRVKGRNVQIDYLLDYTEIETADLVFIARSEKKRLGLIRQHLANKPILTISDTEGFGAKGVLINMINVDSNIRYEINRKAFEELGLKISSLLLASAIIVETDD